MVEAGLTQGFVLEPGSVEVTWRADPNKHPRDHREMVITITGTGRMAAAHELPGKHPQAVEPQGDQPEQKQLTIGEEVPPPSPA